MPLASTTLDTLNRTLNERREEAVQANQPWVPLWTDGADYIFGNQLQGKEPKGGWVSVQANHLFPAMMTELSTIARRRVRPVGLPWNGEDPTDQEAASTWGPFLAMQYLHDLSMPEIVLQALLDGKVYGHWITRSVWNPRKRWSSREKRWIGGIEVQVLWPDFVGIDPECERPDWSDATWKYCRWRMRVDRMVRQWPKHKSQIEQAAQEELGHERGTAAGVANTASSVYPQRGRDIPKKGVEGRLAALVGWPQTLGARTAGGRQQETGKPVYCTVEEWYYADAEEGKGGAPKYPNGRFVLRVGESTILNDTEAGQRWRYDYDPLVPGRNLPLPHTWRGMNAVEMARGMQDLINEAWTHLLHQVRKFGDPSRKVEQGALYGAADDLSNISRLLGSGPGTIIKCVTGRSGGVNLEDPPPMNQGMFQFMQAAEEVLRDLTGAQRAALGRQLERQATATEFQGLMQASRDRPALEAELLDDYLLRQMRVCAAIYQKELKKGDKIRLMGEDGGLRMADYDQKMKDLRFDLRLETTSTMPWDEQAQQVKWLKLAETFGPEVVAEELLRAMRVQNPNDILERLPIWRRIQEELEAEKQQAASPQRTAQSPQTTAAR